MLKNYYLKELQLAMSCKIGSRGPEVKRTQEWLNLWSFKLPNLPRIAIDGDFGPATRAAVIAFQKSGTFLSDGQPGVVDQNVYSALASPLKKAFDQQPAGTMRETLVAYARQHLLEGARELGFNEGPWVRSYMNGLEGKTLPWCVGFIQTIFDQALSFSGKKYSDFMPPTFSCDVLGHHALKQRSLLRNKELRANATSIKPGDLFLVSRTPTDWTHVGIIEKVEGKVFYTLEGNTNEAGSREGVAVMRRIRNFHTNPLDVIRFPELDQL